MRPLEAFGAPKRRRPIFGVGGTGVGACKLGLHQLIRACPVVPPSGSARGHREIFELTLQPLLLACGGCGLITHCCHCFAMRHAPERGGKTSKRMERKQLQLPRRARKGCSVLSLQQEAVEKGAHFVSSRKMLRVRQLLKAKHNSTLQEAMRHLAGPSVHLTSKATASERCPLDQLWLFVVREGQQQLSQLLRLAALQK